MLNNTHGRHRKPKPAAKMAGRTAVVTGTAVAAVVLSAGAAGAAPADNPFPCTGTPFDNVTRALTGSFC